jgi:hypothetical protein
MLWVPQPAQDNFQVETIITLAVVLVGLQLFQQQVVLAVVLVLHLRKMLLVITELQIQAEAALQVAVQEQVMMAVLAVRELLLFVI